jgi:hypothetical protein
MTYQPPWGPDPEPYQPYEPQPGYQAPQPPPQHDPRWEPDPRFAPQPEPDRAWASHQRPPQNPYRPQPPGRQPRPSNRPSKKRRWPYVLGVAIVAIISFAIGDAAGGSGKTASPSSPSSAAAAQSAPVSSSPAPRAKASAAAPAQPRVLARFKGSGIQNTSRFTVAGSGNWELKWSYNCASFGDSGNFIVGEDGDNDFNGASVNELGPRGHGVTHIYGDAGSHYLDVNSECDWTLKAVSLP